VGELDTAGDRAGRRSRLRWTSVVLVVLGAIAVAIAAGVVDASRQAQQIALSNSPEAVAWRRFCTGPFHDLSSQYNNLLLQGAPPGSGLEVQLRFAAEGPPDEIGGQLTSVLDGIAKVQGGDDPQATLKSVMRSVDDLERAYDNTCEEKRSLFDRPS
jgi:hypothetical protein